MEKDQGPAGSRPGRRLLRTRCRQRQRNPFHHARREEELPCRRRGDRRRGGGRSGGAAAAVAASSCVSTRMMWRAASSTGWATLESPSAAATGVSSKPTIAARPSGPAGCPGTKAPGRASRSFSMAPKASESLEQTTAVAPLDASRAAPEAPPATVSSASAPRTGTSRPYPAAVMARSQPCAAVGTHRVAPMPAQEADPRVALGQQHIHGIFRSGGAVHVHPGVVRRR